MTPDPREARLPGWVRETLQEQRRCIHELEEMIKDIQGEQPVSNVKLIGRPPIGDINLPKNAQVAFESKWGTIKVGHNLDGKVRIQGDSLLALEMHAGNALSVTLKD